MNTNIKKPLFLICLILFGLSAYFAPLAKASTDSNQQAITVQSHFHFQDPATGTEMTTAKLQALLDHAHGNGTYLQEGVTFATMLDDRQAFANGVYSTQTQNIEEMLNEAVGSPTASDLGIKSLENVLTYNFPATEDSIDIWDTFQDRIHGFDQVNIFPTIFPVITAKVISDYFSVCTSTDDDARAWGLVSSEATVPGPEVLHQLCICLFAYRQMLQTTLQPDVDQYVTDVNQLIDGHVVLDYSPNKYYLNAPVDLNISAFTSTGNLGNTPYTYQWTLDGVQVSTAEAYDSTYWTPGQHTVVFTMTGGGGIFSQSDTFTISPPIVSTSIYDPYKRIATFSTPVNQLIDSAGKYTWDFGDGSPPVVTDTPTSGLHYFPDNAFYTVSVTEQTQIGTSVTGSTTVNFTSNPPTYISGGVISNTTEWGISGSPYRIHGNLTIPAGVRLTLDPGVVLQFDSGIGINVYGELVSKGQYSATQQVYLTSYRDNSPASLPTPGTDAGQPGDWQGLTFFPGSSGTLTACVEPVMHFSHVGVPLPA